MQVLDINKNFIKSFDTYEDAYIETAINKLPVLSFDVPYPMGKYFKEEGYIQIPNGEFLIKEKKKSSNKYIITAKPNMDDFFKDFYANYTHTTDTFKNIIQPHLTPIGWTVICAETDKQTVTGRDKTLFEIILDAVQVFGYEFIWDIANKTLTVAKNLGADKGAFLHEEVNLRELNLTTQTYDFVTRLVPRGKDGVGIEGVNNGIPYLEPTNKITNKVVYGVWSDERYTVLENLKAAGQKLIDSLAKVYKSYEIDVIDLEALNIAKFSYLKLSLGDWITLVDNENETREKQRIIAKKEYLRETIKNSVKLCDSPLSIVDIQEKIQSDLETKITVNRQYITVLEGEIKAKVSREDYTTLEDRVQAAEQKITPEAITNTVTNSVKYTNDMQNLQKQITDAASVSKITEYYLASSQQSGVTTSTAGWTTAVQTTDASKPYLWNYEVTELTNGTSSSTLPVIIGKYSSDGKDGVSITGVVNYYALSTSNSTAPTTGWSTTPSVTTTTYRYLWNYEEISYSNGTKTTTPKVVIGTHGLTGSDGLPGKDGVGLKSTTVTYGVSTSATTQPNTWNSTVPTVPKGQYLWTKSVWTYTDNTSEVSYSVAYMGTDGNNGTNGIAGKDGVGIKSTVTDYTQSSNGTTAPTTGWSATPPAITPGNYLWSRTTWTYTDSTSEIGYSVAKSPDSNYTWTKYADDDKGSGMSDSAAGKRYVGMAFNKTTSVESSNPADYMWSPLYDNVSVGGRNLVLKSDTKKIGVTAYNVGQWDLSEELIAGETYTITVYGPKITGGTLGLWRDSGGLLVKVDLPYNEAKKRYEYTFICPAEKVGAVKKRISLYNYPPNTTPKNADVYFIKLEKGNIATDWTPAWEDYTTEEKFNLSIDEQTQINLGFDSTLGQLAARTNTVEQKITDEALTIAVTQSSTYKNDLSSLKQADVDLKNQFGVELNGFKDEYNQKITDVDGKILEMTNYFRYDAVNNWAEIGSTGSDFLMRLSNSMLGFYESGNIVAYLSNQKLFIKEAVIQESITIGNHKMMKYDNNLTIILWTGGAV